MFVPNVVEPAWYLRQAIKGPEVFFSEAFGWIQMR